MKPAPIPNSCWLGDHLLDELSKGRDLELSLSTLKTLDEAGIAFVLNLMSREHFLSAGSDRLFGPFSDLLNDPSVPERPKVGQGYSFWPYDEEELPATSLARGALDTIDHARREGLSIMLHGSGSPARAVIVAGCWLARHNYCASDEDDLEITRLGWLQEQLHAAAAPIRGITLTDPQRAFVYAWPRGLSMEEPEVAPWRTARFWLRVLPMVWFYLYGPSANHRVDVPVVDGRRVSNGADIHLELADLDAGTWIGERTLQLRDGSAVVFTSPHPLR